MSESIQTGIYQLRDSVYQVDGAGILKKIDVDMEFLDFSITNSGYVRQELDESLKCKHELRLYHKRWSTNIRWKDFFKDVVKPSAEIIKNEKSYIEGFVLLVGIKRSKQIYSITGGLGHIQLQKFINYQFGLDILSRLIDTNDKVLKSAKERNFVGGLMGSVKFFRGDYNLNENSSFGNFYQELTARLDNRILKDVFKFEDEEIKKGNLCDAKSSFTLKKPVPFEKAIEIIESLHELKEANPKADLNLIKKLDRSDKDLVGKLEVRMYEQLYKVYKGSASDVNFEICHKEFEKYYAGNEFKVYTHNTSRKETEPLTSCANFNEVISEYKNLAVSIANFDDFKNVINSTEIECFDHNGFTKTIGKLVDHLCAEIPYRGRSYFLFNKEWYLIKSDFEKELNNQCREFVAQNQIKNLLLKWNYLSDSENVYNAAYIDNKHTLVFDKVTPDNIEVCDVLKWSKNEVYFIHIKKGFNNEMRNLCRQVHIAARRVNQDLKEGKIFLGKLYDTLAEMNVKDDYFKKAQRQLSSITKKEFLKVFDGKKPVFVLAVLDDAKRNCPLSEIHKYDSNIAKFCLQQLCQEMRLLNVELRIAQIDK